MEKFYCPVCGDEAELVRSDYATGVKTVDCYIHGVRDLPPMPLKGQGRLFGEESLELFLSFLAVLLISVAIVCIAQRASFPVSLISISGGGF